MARLGWLKPYARPAAALANLCLIGGAAVAWTMKDLVGKRPPILGNTFLSSSNDLGYLVIHCTGFGALVVSCVYLLTFGRQSQSVNDIDLWLLLAPSVLFLLSALLLLPSDQSGTYSASLGFFFLSTFGLIAFQIRTYRKSHKWKEKRQRLTKQLEDHFLVEQSASLFTSLVACNFLPNCYLRWTVQNSPEVLTPNTIWEILINEGFRSSSPGEVLGSAFGLVIYIHAFVSIFTFKKYCLCFVAIIPFLKFGVKFWDLQTSYWNGQPKGETFALWALLIASCCMALALFAYGIIVLILWWWYSGFYFSPKISQDLATADTATPPLNSPSAIGSSPTCSISVVSSDGTNASPIHRDHLALTTPPLPPPS